MKNFVQPGKEITITAPYARSSGDGVMVGQLFGVCTTDIGNGASGEVMTDGVFSLSKTSAQAWVAGDAIYWDATNKVVTNVASGACVGVAVLAAANPSSTGKVLLTPTSLRLARGGAQTLDGSNPTPVTTGLSTISYASVQLRGTAAPGDSTSVLTVDYTGSDGTLNVYAWKNTGGTDPTLVASTGTETFDWIAFGS